MNDSDLRECFWPGCTVMRHKKYFGCRDHWYQLPISIRQAVNREAKRVKQLGKVTIEYARVVMVARKWASDYIDQHEECK